MQTVSNGLDKESPVKLPQQLRQILQQRIESAYYAPGRKIDSVRKISAEFKVSSLTVQRALRQLESDGFVVSVPASGVYVNKEFATAKQNVKIAFVFPEAAISREILDPEGWALDSEVYRGLLYGGEKYGAQIDFFHVDKNMDYLHMLHRLKKIREYNAVVFIGEQLQELQMELAQERLVYQFPSGFFYAIPGVIAVDYDRNRAVEILAEHAQACSCKTVGTISYFNSPHSITSPREETEVMRNFRHRARLFLQSCQRYGLETPDDLQLEFNSREDFVPALKKALKESRADFIFCNQTYFVRNLYETCAELGIRIGKDLKIAAIASGMTFQGLIPSLTYVKVPMFELAVNVVRDTCQRIADNISVEDLTWKTLSPPLIVGESTSENQRNCSGAVSGISEYWNKDTS